jgi:hypothetical protein
MRGRTSSALFHLLQVVRTWYTGELETGETVDPLTLKSLEWRDDSLKRPNCNYVTFAAEYKIMQRE